MKVTYAFAKALAIASLALFSFGTGAVNAQQTPKPPLQVKTPKDGIIDPIVVDVAPDLVIDGFEQYGEPVQVGGQLHVPIKVRVHNKSMVDINEKVLCAVRVGDDFPWHTFMMPLEENMMDVAIGVVKFNYNPQNNPSGQVTLTAHVDAPVGPDEIPVEDHGRVLEFNESNNERSIVIRVAADGDIDSGSQQPSLPGDVTGQFPNPDRAKPDLRITWDELSGHVRYKGEYLEAPFFARVKNDGGAAVNEKTVFGVRVYNNYVWHAFIPPLKPGEAAYTSGTIRIHDPTRKYSGTTIPAMCFADAAIGPDEVPVAEHGRVLEEDETNNHRTLFLDVPALTHFGPQPNFPVHPNPNFQNGGQQNRPRPGNNEFYILPWYGKPNGASPRPGTTRPGRPATPRPAGPNSKRPPNRRRGTVSPAPNRSSRGQVHSNLPTRRIVPTNGNSSARR